MIFVNVGHRNHCEHEHPNRSEAEKCLLEHQKERRLSEKPPLDWAVMEVESLEALEDELQLY